MPNIYSNGFFSAFKTDLNRLQIVKTRCKHSCNICNKSIPKGSYCLGTQWAKVCLSCADKFLITFIKSVEEFKAVGEDVLKDINKNREKYTANNTLARI